MALRRIIATLALALAVTVAARLLSNAVLLTACHNRSVGRTRAALRLGANPDARDAKGISALYWAARNGDLDIVSTLLEHGASPGGEPGRIAPLVGAAQMGHTAVVKVLLKSGALLNDLRSGNCPALYVAVLNDRRDTVSVLLHSGASVAPFSGESLTDIARRHGSAEIEKMLRDRGAR
jgi:uncharacterized protein